MKMNTKINKVLYLLVDPFQLKGTKAYKDPCRRMTLKLQRRGI